MRRTILAAIVLLTAATALAINTGTRAVSIALLPPVERYADRRDAQTSDDVRNLVRDELQRRGYDAFVTNDVRPRADFYVDVEGAGGGSHPVGGIDVGGRNAGVEVAVIVSRVAASLTLYDGRTLERLQTLDLHKRNTAVAPTAVGIGGRSIWAFIGVPVMEWAQYRTGLRAIARDAARQIDEALRP